jgi:uncharacterized membrane protein HdeD (DUF308 family)
MQNWFLWFITGVLSLVAGFIALANPFAATVTAELMAGYMFAAIGILILFSAFQDQGLAARLWALLLGLAIAAFGFNLIANPLEGILRLTFIVAAFMLVIGVFRILIALTPIAAGARIFLAVSGLVSIVLAVMIFTNYPWSSAVVLGVFLAVELISNGVSLIFLSLARRSPNASVS